MSYLEGLSKYTEDLTNQRDNFENMINQHKDRLGDQFQRKFDEITQNMEMVGGAIGQASMGVHGLARAKEHLTQLMNAKGIDTSQLQGKGKSTLFGDKPEEFENATNNKLVDTQGRGYALSEKGQPMDMATVEDSSAIQMSKFGDVEEGGSTLVDATVSRPNPSRLFGKIDLGNFGEEADVASPYGEHPIESMGSRTQSSMERMFSKLKNVAQKPIDQNPDLLGWSSKNVKVSQAGYSQNLSKAQALIEDEESDLYGGLDSWKSAGRSIMRDGLKNPTDFGGGIASEHGVSQGASGALEATSDKIGENPLRDSIQSGRNKLKVVPEGERAVDYDSLEGFSKAPQPAEPAIADVGKIAQAEANAGPKVSSWATTNALKVRGGLQKTISQPETSNDWLNKDLGRTPGSKAPAPYPEGHSGVFEDATNVKPPQGSTLYDPAKGGRKFENFDSQYGKVANPKAPNLFEGEAGEGAAADIRGGINSAVNNSKGMIQQAGKNMGLSEDSMGLMENIGGKASKLLNGGVELGEGVGIEEMAGIGMEAMGGIGEAVGAGVLLAGVLHDVLSKPKEVDQVNAGSMSGKVGFNPSAVAGIQNTVVGTA